MTRGYKASTLCWAASQQRRATELRAATGPVAVEVHSRGRAERRTPSSGKTPRFLPVRTRAVGPAVAEIVIEIGAARVRVLRGFDACLRRPRKSSPRRTEQPPSTHAKMRAFTPPRHNASSCSGYPATSTAEAATNARGSANPRGPAACHRAARRDRPVLGGRFEVGGRSGRQGPRRRLEVAASGAAGALRFEHRSRGDPPLPLLQTRTTRGPLGVWRINSALRDWQRANRPVSHPLTAPKFRQSGRGPTPSTRSVVERASSCERNETTDSSARATSGSTVAKRPRQASGQLRHPA